MSSVLWGGGQSPEFRVSRQPALGPRVCTRPELPSQAATSAPSAPTFCFVRVPAEARGTFFPQETPLLEAAVCPGPASQ